MAVRSARITGPVEVTGTTGAPEAILEMPGGHTALIKTIWCSNPGTTAKSLFVYVNGTGVGSIVLVRPVPVGDTVVIVANLVLTGEDVLYAAESTGTGLELVLTLVGSYLLGETDFG